MKQKNLVPHILLIYMFWGFNWVVMRVASDYYDPFFFVACRLSIGAAALLIVCAVRGTLIPPRKYWGWILFSGLLMMSMNNLMVQISIHYIGAGLAAVLNYTQSVFVCILAVIILHERFTIRKALGIVFCVAGLLILMNIETTAHIWAVFVALGSAFMWACSSIIVKAKFTGCDMLQYTAWQLTFGSIVLILYLILFSPEALHDGIQMAFHGNAPWVFRIGTLLYNGLLASATAFVLWNYILTNMEAGKASIAVMAVPAVGVILGVLILHEPMTIFIAIGILLIFAGIFVVLSHGQKTQTKSTGSR